MVMAHGDDKGIIWPPKVAPLQIVIVPIIFKDSSEAVMEKSKEIMKKLKAKNHSVELDDRDYTPGWKFNEWELKGVPLRIEIGPKDIEKDQLILVRRDTNEKITIKTKDLDKKIEETLQKIQENLFNTAKEYLLKHIVLVHNMHGLTEAITNKKMAQAPFCGNSECENIIKDKAEGATCRCIPFEQKPVAGNCVACSNMAKSWALFAKNY